MNRFFKFLVMSMVILSSTNCLLSCKNKGENSQSSQIKEELLAFDKFDLDLYMKPLWDGQIVYNETVMFVGEDDEATLLYPVTEIISVRSYDLKTEYLEGVDYVFDKVYNSIYPIKGGKMPIVSKDDYYPERKINSLTFETTNPDYTYIQCAEGSYFSQMQIAVTYRHSGATLEKPKSYSFAFEKTLNKLKNNKPTKILFYGDSITVGANASGFEGVNYPPYADIWAKMVFNSLVKKYSSTSAEYINTAVGGWTSTNGYNNLTERVISHNPDLIFIGFGMNDGATSPQKHLSIIKAMVEEIWQNLPNAEICLVSPMLANSEVKGFYNQQDCFEVEYENYANQLKNSGSRIGVATVTNMHKQLLNVKRYYDMTGNNVNHPNDFLSRIYAQTVLYTILGE